MVNFDVPAYIVDNSNRSSNTNTTNSKSIIVIININCISNCKNDGNDNYNTIITKSDIVIGTTVIIVIIRIMISTKEDNILINYRNEIDYCYNYNTTLLLPQQMIIKCDN